VKVAVDLQGLDMRLGTVVRQGYYGINGEYLGYDPEKIRLCSRLTYWPETCEVLVSREFFAVLKLSKYGAICDVS
jgi:hypothetical protein